MLFRTYHMPLLTFALPALLALYSLAGADELQSEVTPSDAEKSRRLPPLSPKLRDDSRLSSLGKVFIEKFLFEGNTVFSGAELSTITAPYQNREISAGELRQVQKELTRHYVENGYVSSGAIIPDQRLQDRTVRVRIIEGRLTQIEIEGNDDLHEQYLVQRLSIDVPLNILDLQRRIKLLQRNPLIQRINTQLGPGANLGEGLLQVRIEEEQPYEFGFTADNHRSPSVGSEHVELHGIHRNLSGWGDSLEARYSFQQGPENYLLSYNLPVTHHDTTLSFTAERNNSIVVEAPFNQLDIKSKFNRYALTLRHPLTKTPSRELGVSLGIESRRAVTYLLGQPFSFSPGIEDGRSKVVLFQFSQDWTDQGADQLIAARSTFNIGTHWLNATRHDKQPDGQHLSWLGQFQLIRLLPFMESHLLARANIQIANRTLLPSEKFAFGGAATVRGYRENLLTRDSALVGSLEWQIPIGHLQLPVISTEPEHGELKLALFYDYARGWDDLDTAKPKSISGAGVGLLWSPSDKMGMSLYWGQALRNVDLPKERDIQDDGIHFQIGVRIL